MRRTVSKQFEIVRQSSGGSLKERRRSGLIRLKPRSTTSNLVRRGVVGGCLGTRLQEVYASVWGKNILHTPRRYALNFYRFFFRVPRTGRRCLCWFLSQLSHCIKAPKIPWFPWVHVEPVVCESRNVYNQQFVKKTPPPFEGKLDTRCVKPNCFHGAYWLCESDTAK